MQSHHVLLSPALDRDERHRRPSHRFADRLRVSRIILIGLHIWANKRWAHQLNFVSKLGDAVPAQLRRYFANVFPQPHRLGLVLSRKRPPLAPPVFLHHPLLIALSCSSG